MKPGYVLLVAVGVVAGAMHLDAEDAVSVTVRPAVTMQGSARLKALVARDERNRLLIWEVDGPGYYRASYIELEGAAAPRTYSLLVQGLPPGDFEVRAIVKRNDLTDALDVTNLKVIGPD